MEEEREQMDRGGLGKGENNVARVESQLFRYATVLGCYLGC